MITIIEHKGKQDLENQFCEEISSKLRQAVEKNGYANMLVSGGSTPIGFFKKLSLVKLRWDKIQIGLVDDRFVPIDHEKSNEKLVKENLLINEAASGQFLGLVYNTDSRDENLQIASKIYSRFHSRIDITILGMGGDGHTASLFPKDNASRAILTSENYDLLANTQADVAPFERVTCTRFLLHKSNNLYLMMTGKEKRKVLEEAKLRDYPIAYFLETNTTKLKVYYSE